MLLLQSNIQFPPSNIQQWICVQLFCVFVAQTLAPVLQPRPMKPDPRIFDDISRVAGGAMNVFSALREQVTNDIKARVEEMAARMDLVPREDFDRLAAQVQKLQKQIDSMSGVKAAKPAKQKQPAQKPSAKTGKKKK